MPFEEISDLQWVGSGAQGAVFLGKLHGQEVAVKKVRNIKETDIKHLRKLKHPNIITFKLVRANVCDICPPPSGSAFVDNCLLILVFSGVFAPRRRVTASSWSTAPRGSCTRS